MNRHLLLVSPGNESSLHDGNKRTAYAVMDTFLRVNGYTLNLTDEESYMLVLKVANGSTNKNDLASFLQKFAIPIA